MWQVIQVEAKFVETLEYLEHHGILGMKWGVRRYQNKDGTLTAAGRKRYLNPDGSYNDTAKKEIPLTAMSNKELQDAINRLNLEQQYIRLTTPPGKGGNGGVGGNSHKAAQFVLDALEKIGKTSVDVAMKAITKAFDDHAAEQAPKKKEKISDFSEYEKEHPEELSLKDLNTYNALSNALEKANERKKKPKGEFDGLNLDFD